MTVEQELTLVMATRERVMKEREVLAMIEQRLHVVNLRRL